jgi:hypothetical protein
MFRLRKSKDACRLIVSALPLFAGCNCEIRLLPRG